MATRELSDGALDMLVWDVLVCPLPDSADLRQLADIDAPHRLGASRAQSDELW